jgi:hypothetical protein
VTHNGLDGDGEALLALLAAMPALRALYLSAGNPIASAVRPYRKRVIAAAQGLVYLDERPVFDAERRGAEAWVRGGEEAEKAERDKLTVRRKRDAKRRQFNSYAFMRRTGGEEGCDARQLRAHHSAARGCAGASSSRRRRARCVFALQQWRAVLHSTLSFLLPRCAGETLPEESDAPEPSDNNDPPELLRAREALAQYSAAEGIEEPLELTHTRAALAAAGRLKGDGVPDAAARDVAADAEQEALEAAGRAAWAARQEGDAGWYPLGGVETEGVAAAAATETQPPQQQPQTRPPPRAAASLSPDDDDGVAVAAPRPFVVVTTEPVPPAAPPPRRAVVIEEIESDSDDDVDSASETEEPASLIAQAELIAPAHGSLADID